MTPDTTRDPAPGRASGEEPSRTTPDLAASVASTTPEASDTDRGFATEIKEGARAAVRETRDALQDEGSRLTRRARREADGLVERRTADLAGQLEGMARGLRQMAGDGPTPLGGPSARAADGLERAATYLREQDLGGFLRDAESFARRHPEAFVGGLAVAGIALGRFLRASERPTDDRRAVAGPETVAYTHTYPEPAGRPVHRSDLGGTP